jgi:methionyl-tRNA formyltransferase
VRVVLLAASPLAQPLFRVLCQTGNLIGLATTGVSVVSLELWAKQAGVPSFTTDRSGTDLQGWIESLRADCLITFTFPYRLKPGVLAAPRLGCFNFHGGRLPEYRGPQPIFWQIVKREPMGALCVHRMTEEFDQGPLVANLPVPIAPEETYGIHAHRLAHAAAPLAQQFLEDLERSGTALPEVVQDEARARFYPNPAPDDLVIRWDELDAAEIRALVKAGNPWNHGALASIRGVQLRIADASVLLHAGSAAEAPGAILVADREQGLVVNCRDGSALRIDIVSMEEGILPGSFLAALGIRAGERFAVPVRG